jgi:hypothetical protein
VLKWFSCHRSHTNGRNISTSWSQCNNKSFFQTPSRNDLCTAMLIYRIYSSACVETYKTFISQQHCTQQFLCLRAGEHIHKHIKFSILSRADKSINAQTPTHKNIAPLAAQSSSRRRRFAPGWQVVGRSGDRSAASSNLHVEHVTLEAAHACTHSRKRSLLPMENSSQPSCPSACYVCR